MTAVVVIAVVVLALSVAAIIYPYVIYPLVLGRLPTKPLAPSDEQPGSDQFAVLFCAYNEASVAQAKVDNLRRLTEASPGVEILVYDDASTDGGDLIFESASPLIRLVRGPGRTGKAHGMKQLVRLTRRPFLVFTDANVMLDGALINELAKSFADPTVGGVCGHLTYLSHEDSATEAAGGAYWSLDEKLKSLESATGNVMGGDGSIFAVRRDLYPDFLDSVQDDFTVTMSVVFAGSRLIFAPNVIAYENLVAESSDEYRRKVRIAARAFHTHKQMRPSIRQMSGLDRWKYVSHKIVRWFGGAFLGSASLAVLVLTLTLSPWLALAGALLGVAGWFLGPKVLRPIGVIKEIVLALVATFHGVVLASMGRTFTTWSPPKSR